MVVWLSCRDGEGRRDRAGGAVEVEGEGGRRNPCMEAKLKTDGEERVTWAEEERERRGLLWREKAGPMWRLL